MTILHRTNSTTRISAPSIYLHESFAQRRRERFVDLWWRIMLGSALLLSMLLALALVSGLAWLTGLLLRELARVLGHA